MKPRHEHRKPSHGAGSLDCFLDRQPLLLDIETTGLKADYGLAMVIGVSRYTPSGPREPVRQFKIDIRKTDMEKSERDMLEDFRAFMEQEVQKEGGAGIITFNGTRFDIPFIQARLMAQGLPLLPKMRHLDLFYVIKNTLRYTVTSRRAKYIQSIFKIGDPKAPLKDSSQMFTWLRATFSRDTAAFQRIVDHNRNECLQSLLYQTRRLRGLAPQSIPLR